MITVSPQSRGNILVLGATGKLTDKDYKDVLIPRLEAIIRAHGKARLLPDMGDEFHGRETAAAWDAALASRHRPCIGNRHGYLETELPEYAYLDEVQNDQVNQHQHH